MFSFSDIEIDETVDVYGDLEGKCRRGLKVSYEGRKQLVGTGHLKQLRCDIFDDNIKPRYSPKLIYTSIIKERV